jgi:hypothetical protein
MRGGVEYLRCMPRFGCRGGGRLGTTLGGDHGVAGRDAPRKTTLLAGTAFGTPSTL